MQDFGLPYMVPGGHVAAPTAVSMLHAGVLMKLGAYGIIRVGMFLLPEGADTWMPVLITLGTVNVLYGAVSAMSQNDLKYIIGYSSVSHMGYVLMGIATLDNIGVGGAVLQMFSHGMMTALMFLLVGSIYHQTHTRDINVLNGLASRMPVNTFFFAIAGMASLGLPGLSGFIAEFMVFTGAFRTYMPLAFPRSDRRCAYGGLYFSACWPVRSWVNLTHRGPGLKDSSPGLK
ncbi:MAG: hypothetical protein CM1200mP27_12190 [Chloroflexota bacterium]|nr:MAG: hypothetical protein CM1200mP27_12190 [Chloroflexota bacterium]